MLQAIKCILYQVYDWSRVDEAIISDILVQDSGWIIDNDITRSIVNNRSSIMVDWYVFNFILAFPY